MSGIFAVKELELRKKALAAESEVYRETLKLEARNLGLYARYAKLKLSNRSAINPLLMLAPALTGFLLRPRRPRKMPRMLATVLLGWQMYSKFAPLCRNMFQSYLPRRFRGDQRIPTSNI
jgi:hypothetical protein